MREKLRGKELEHAIDSRIVAKKLAIDQAIKGNAICGGYFALLNSHPLASYLDDLEDYSDEDDEIRPF